MHEKHGIDSYLPLQLGKGSNYYNQVFTSLGSEGGQDLYNL